MFQNFFLKKIVLTSASIKTYCCRKYRNYLSLQFTNNVLLLKKKPKGKKRSPSITVQFIINKNQSKKLPHQSVICLVQAGSLLFSQHTFFYYQHRSYPGTVSLITSTPTIIIHLQTISIHLLIAVLP